MAVDHYDICDANYTYSSSNDSFHCLYNGSHYSAGSNEGVALVSRILTKTGNTLGVLAIVLNIIFLLAVVFLSNSSTTYHRFMKNLAMADIMASLTFLITQNWPQGPFARIHPQHDFLLLQGLPYVFRGIPWMFFTAYLLTLSALTVNQYIAVCRPWKYSELVTVRVVCATMTGVWLLSSLQIIIPLLVLLVLWAQSDRTRAQRALFVVSKIEVQVWMCVFAASTIFNIINNTLIYRKIRNLKLRRRFSSSLTQMDSQNIRTKQEAFVTVTLLLLASIFCRLPFPLMGIIGINIETNMDLDMKNLVNSLVVFLLFTNFFADPIIYVLRMKEIRRSFKVIFHACPGVGGQAENKRGLSGVQQQRQQGREEQEGEDSSGLAAQARATPGRRPMLSPEVTTITSIDNTISRKAYNGCSLVDSELETIL